MKVIEIIESITQLIKYPDIDDNEWILKEIEKLIHEYKRSR
jgi:hypothetical protein